MLHRDCSTKFQPPKGCSLASGDIGPTGWCKLYDALPEKARYFSRTERPPSVESRPLEFVLMGWKQNYARRCARAGLI